ncbi:MAG: hypothetical protein ACREB2_11615 [Pseudolabrys sp.]
MNRKLLIVALASVALACCTGPGPGLTGNDTGGIITWSPEHQQAARDWAGEQCARYGKYARITSIHRQYGDYIGFSCVFDPRKRPPG